jgi:hypothetical protein
MAKEDFFNNKKLYGDKHRRFRMKITVYANQSAEMAITREEWEAIGKKNGWNDELLEGGKGDGLGVEDLAEMHEVGTDKIEKQLEIGMEIEKEHSPDPEIRKEISTDHIVESDEYYDDLEEMEKKYDAEKADKEESDLPDGNLG